MLHEQTRIWKLEHEPLAVGKLIRFDYELKPLTMRQEAENFIYENFGFIVCAVPVILFFLWLILR